MKTLQRYLKTLFSAATVRKVGTTTRDRFDDLNDFSTMTMTNRRKLNADRNKFTKFLDGFETGNAPPMTAHRKTAKYLYFIDFEKLRRLDLTPAPDAQPCITAKPEEVMVPAEIWRQG